MIKPKDDIDCKEENILMEANSGLEWDYTKFKHTSNMLNPSLLTGSIPRKKESKEL